MCFKIGSGAFGRVVLATAVGILEWEPKTTVAVKMCKPPVTKPQLVGLMSEIKIMLHLGKHLNVVNLLGACTMELSKSKKRTCSQIVLYLSAISCFCSVNLSQSR